MFSCSLVVLLSFFLVSCAAFGAQVSLSSSIPDENQKVFILTQPRSGSTFVGELFRKNPDFAYLFEPLRYFSEPFTQDACSATPVNPNLEGIMKAVYNCDFSALKNALPETYIYSWERIEQFSGQFQHCLAPNSSEPRARKMGVAVKEIEQWAPKLNWLNSILNSELYVIWLVRDVRGWVSSWLVDGDHGANFFSDWAMDQMDLWSWYSDCSILKNNRIVNAQLLAKIKDILTNSSSPTHLKVAAWWTLDIAVSYHYTSLFKGKLKLVTYEQVSAHPLAASKEIYSFLNRSSVPTEVLSYLSQSTKGGDVKDRYDTKRNSKAMIDIWQSRLSPTQIREIEEIAGVWFEFFGYEKFTTYSA